MKRNTADGLFTKPSGMMVSQKVRIRRQGNPPAADQIQGAQILRNEAYFSYAAVTKDAVEHRSWTFCEAVFMAANVPGYPLQNLLTGPALRRVGKSE